MTLEKDFLAAIQNTLEKQNYPEWIFADFSTVEDNRLIRVLLDRAYMETALRDYRNRHGIDHGLATAYNSIRLFTLVDNKTVKSDYMSFLDFSKEEVLFTLMTAGLIHDTGRFYDDTTQNHEEHVNDTIAVLVRMVQLGEILSKSAGIKSGEIVRRVKELCLCHDKKQEPSGKVEIALMKLADALDVGPHRVYNNQDKKELETDEESKLMRIFNRDRHPGRYFGQLSIRNVTIAWNDRKQILEVTFQIGDYACAEEIKKVLDILSACNQSSDHDVRIMSKNIYVYVVGPKTNQYRIYPIVEKIAQIHTEDMEIAKLRIAHVCYKIDILNMEGDANIDVTTQFKNVDNAEGIGEQVMTLGGDYPSKWEDLKMRWFEMKISGSKELPRPEPVHSDQRTHQFRVNFGRKINLGESIMLDGKGHWARFLNIMQSSFTHSVLTHTDKLRIEILFPLEASEFDLIASSEERDLDEKMLFASPVDPKQIDGRLALAYETNVLKPRRKYVLFWKLIEWKLETP